MNHPTVPNRAGILRSLSAAGCAAIMLFSTVPAFAQKGRAPVAPGSNQLVSRSGGGKSVAPAETTGVRVISRAIDLSEAARSAGAAPKSGAITNTFPTTEGFDNITTLVPGGWFFQNNSTPVGTLLNYGQGNPSVFVSQSGATDSYIAANFNSVAGANTISNWMLTPSGTFNNGDVISFYTRTTDGFFPDRLQLRLSVNGASTNVGTLPDDVGDFTTLALDINPGLTSSGYPTTFTQFVLTLAGLPSGGLSGRIGFRYFVTNGGPSGTNSDYIGIDTFSYSPAVVSTPVNVNSQVSFSVSSQSLGAISGACAGLGYASQFNISASLRNIGTNTLSSPYFQVVALQPTNGSTPANPFRLTTADDFNASLCTGGLVGSTQAIPGPLAPNQVASVTFNLALFQTTRTQFLVSVFATVGSPSSRNARPVKIGTLAINTNGFDKAGNPVLSANFIPEKGQPSLAINQVSVTRAK